MATNQEIIQLDDIDAGIISALSSDGRHSYADINAEVGLSTAAVHERVKKMIERGTIQRFSLQVDPDAVGLNFTAFVAIRNDGGAHCRDIAPRLRTIAAVQELHSVAGEYDFLAKVRTRRARDLEGVLAQIKSIPGVARTTSTVVLNTVFEGQPLKLGTHSATESP